MVRQRLLVSDDLPRIRLLMFRLVFSSLLSASLVCLWVAMLLLICFMALGLGSLSLIWGRWRLGPLLCSWAFSFGTPSAFAATPALLAAFLLVRLGCSMFARGRGGLSGFSDFERLALLMDAAGFRKLGFGWGPGIGSWPLVGFGRSSGIIMRPFSLIAYRAFIILLSILWFDLDCDIRYIHLRHVFFVWWIARIFSILVVDWSHLWVVFRRRDSGQVKVWHLLVVGRTHSWPLIFFWDCLQTIKFESWVLSFLYTLLFCLYLLIMVYVFTKSEHKVATCENFFDFLMSHCFD